MKQLDPTFTSNVLEGPLPSYPATDFVNPGLGNIVRPFGLYVPLYLYNHTHKKVKEQSEQAVVQEGSGSNVNTRSEDTNQKPEELQDSVSDELNKKKRELLDDAIYQSFLHPRLIKTDTILLKRNTSEPDIGALTNDKVAKKNFPGAPTKNKVPIVGAMTFAREPEKKKLKTMKHSFHVVD